LNAVEAWAAAWSRKDVRTYLSYYDKEFVTPGGVSRKKWEQERQQRVGKPGKISVGVEKPEAKVEGDVATVRFRQHYNSAGFDSSAMKTLELVKRNGKWQIREERIGG
jgi:ketosteroid isomerase-like protein